MKFGPGVTVYIGFAGSIKEAKVIRAFPNTGRYKILQDGNWERIVNEGQIYGSRKEILEKQLKLTNDAIAKFTKEKEQIESELSKVKK